MKSNWKRSFKTLNCRECSTPVKNVDEHAAAVVCWKCVSSSLNGRPLDLDPEEVEKKLGPNCQG